MDVVKILRERDQLKRELSKATARIAELEGKGVKPEPVKPPAPHKGHAGDTLAIDKGKSHA